MHDPVEAISQHGLLVYFVKVFLYLYACAINENIKSYLSLSWLLRNPPCIASALFSFPHYNLPFLF